MKLALASWEGYGRSILRMIVAFTFSLHGYRHLFGLFPTSGGRRAAIPMALDGLPPVAGYLEIAGGLLLLLGLFTRPTALVLCTELLAAYFYSAAPRGPWPIRNGGNEVLLYFLVFLYFAAEGSGAWSVDSLRSKRRNRSRANFQPAGAILGALGLAALGLLATPANAQAGKPRTARSGPTFPTVAASDFEFSGLYGLRVGFTKSGAGAALREARVGQLPVRTQQVRVRSDVLQALTAVRK